jgi:hypothetical protein
MHGKYMEMMTMLIPPPPISFGFIIALYYVRRSLDCKKLWLMHLYATAFCTKKVAIKRERKFM